LKGQGTVAHHMDEIYTIPSLREIDLQ
jgi:hypothetical protein